MLARRVATTVRSARYSAASRTLNCSLSACERSASSFLSGGPIIARSRPKKTLKLARQPAVALPFSSSSAVPPQLASPREIANLLLEERSASASAMLMDVRSAAEVEEPPHLPAPLPLNGGSTATTRSPLIVLHCPVTMDDKEAVNITEGLLVGNGVDKHTTPVVVYCRTGRRAGVAVAALRGLGCVKVVNGGAVEDVIEALAMVSTAQKQKKEKEKKEKEKKRVEDGDGGGWPDRAQAALIHDDKGGSNDDGAVAGPPIISPTQAAVAPPPLLPTPLSSISSSHGSRSSLLLHPYLRLMRLDKPIGTLLLVWPCAWSIALAAPMGCLPDLSTLALFTGGALVMRGAGCTINDWWDRDVDKHVQRTASRPIASGEVTPTEALALFGLQCSVGLGVLLQLPVQSVVLGACSMPLVVLYPLAKRHTKWPQLVLGLTFNWGALLGGQAASLASNATATTSTTAVAASTAVTTATTTATATTMTTAPLVASSFPAASTTGASVLLSWWWSPPLSSSSSSWDLLLVDQVAQASSLPAVWSSVPDFALPLYCGGVCWTLVYDTLYAHQDKADDRKLGLNSSALSIGDELTKPVLLGFSALTLGGIGLAGSELSWPFYAALGAGGAQLAWQVGGAKLNDPKDLWMRFVSNNWFGATITAGIVAGHF